MNRVNGASQNAADGSSGWDQWLAQFAPRLLLFARQQSRCEADAQDLLQDAVVEAWRQQVDDAPPTLGLVFSLIRHRAIDLARRNERRATREMAAQEAALESWFDPEMESREQAKLLQSALGRLSENQREVVTLKIWGELTFAEIAVVLDIPANTAASRFRYALEELRGSTKEMFV